VAKADSSGGTDRLNGRGPHLALKERFVRTIFAMLLPLALLSCLSGCGAIIGDPCTTERDCGPGVCLNRDFAPGGYCSLRCTRGGPVCPAGSVCVESALSRDTAGCMRSCRTSADCRAGYVCKTERDSPTPICIGPEGI
jgi:hypothetical protein